ncbi:MAG TPA: hypothetical protein VMH23_12920 [Bacteroidota bacterium]|nr:hypothetical protein [Bacteroidota bacterium]
MAQRWFFFLGIANNILLIAIFLVRRNHLALLQSCGWLYLLLALPAAYTLFLVQREEPAVQLTVFLGIFLAFLALEGIYEFILKIPFRDDWRLLVPYIVLYLAMNYGFVVMSWKQARTNGIIMLVLFVIQIIANMSSH